MMEVQVKGLEELKDLLERMGEEGRQAAIQGIQEWTDYSYEVSQQLVPVDTGALAGSGQVEKDETGASIRYTAPHAAAVHYGYVRHYVAPRTRKALRWEAGRIERLSSRGSRKNASWQFSKGHCVPAREARSRPNPWLFNAVNRSLQYLKPFILGEYNKIVEAG